LARRKFNEAKIKKKNLNCAASKQIYAGIFCPIFMQLSFNKKPIPLSIPKFVHPKFLPSPIPIVAKFPFPFSIPFYAVNPKLAQLKFIKHCSPKKDKKKMKKISWQKINKHSGNSIHFSLINFLPFNKFIHQKFISPQI
jgi:hypothetical protein